MFTQLFFLFIILSYLCVNIMTEEKEKFSFFTSIKKTLLNSEEKKSADESVENTENVLREITITTVEPTEEKKEIKYSSVSKSNYADIQFAENFIHSKGKFVYCENEKELFHFLNSLKRYKKWNHIFSWNPKLLEFFYRNNFQKEEEDFLLDNSDVAISFCYSIVADSGVVVLSPEQSTNRKMLNFPSTHIIIAYRNQLKENVLKAIEGFEKEYPERLPSLLELHKEKPVTKENSSVLLSADGPGDVYLFYIDTDKIG